MKKLLTILLLSVLVKQIAWSAFIPLWQTPDEQAHYGQVNFTAELNQNELTTSNQSLEIVRSEKILGTNRDSFGNNKYTYHPEYNIPSSANSVGIYEQDIKNISLSDRINFVFKEATNYPPLYYRMAAVVNNLFHSGSLFDRVFAVRLLSGILLTAITYLAYRAGNLLGNEQTGLVLAVLVGWFPMLTFVHSGVTSDTLFNLLFTVLIYLGIKIIVEGIDVLSLFTALIVIACGFATKPQANIMVFTFLPTLVIGLIRQRKIKIDKWFWTVIIVTLAIVFVGLHEILGQLLSGGVRIPNTEGVFVNSAIIPPEHLRFTFVHTYREVLPWYWGVFRWLSLGLPDSLRKITNILTLASFAGVGLFLFKKISKRVFDEKCWVVSYSIIVALVYFSAITVFDYGFRRSHGFSFGIQGRYFFPVILAQMIIFLFGLQELVPINWRMAVGKSLATSMVIFNFISFFWIAVSYYQPSWPTFFLQASQYKPIWLKYPVNEAVLLFAIVLSILFICRLWRMWDKVE